MLSGLKTAPGSPTINRLRDEAQTFGGRSVEAEHQRQDDAIEELRRKAQPGERMVGKPEEQAEGQQMPG